MAANTITITSTAWAPVAKFAAVSMLGSAKLMGRRTAASRTEVITHPMTYT